MTDPRNAYRESAARGASAVGHVVLLYGQIVADMRNAIQAIEACNIEERTNAINHAMVVVSHLQNSLNFEVGGAAATSLSRFYNMVRRKLLEAQFQTSKELLQEQIALLLDLREAWVEVDRTTAVAAEQPVGNAQSSANDAAHRSGGWNA